MNPNNLNNIDKEGVTNHKQINNISGPIRLDEHGRAIDAPIKRTTIESTKKQEKELKELDRSTFIFLLVMLVIVGVLVVFVSRYVLPRKINLEGNKTTTEATTEDVSMFKIYSFSEGLLENGKDMTPSNTGNKKIVIDTNKTLYIVNKNMMLNLYMNVEPDSENAEPFATVAQLDAHYAMVDDTVIFTIRKGQVRATQLLGIDSKGEVKLDVYDVNDIEGLVVDSVSVKGSGLYVKASRVYKDQVITSSQVVGETSGINVCDKKALEKVGIYDTSYSVATFVIGYNSARHKFEEPKKVSAELLSEYIANNNYCLEETNAQ